jgi:hypothetical protein
MRGAGSAPREACISVRSALIAFAVCLIGVFAPAASAAASSTTIDFSEAGPGPFDHSYFSAVSFTEGTWVGYIQGDEALIDGVAGSAKKKFTSISANFAPAAQGTAIYTLTAYKGKTPVGSNAMTVTQDSGDPETGPFGYETIALEGLPKKADSFRLDNSFVRSSFSHVTLIEFGTASITYSD